MSDPRKSVSEELRVVSVHGCLVSVELINRAADEIDRLTAAKSGVGITDEMVGDLLEIAGWFKDNGMSGKHDPDDAYAKVCERAAAALTAAIGKMEGWRPIETAPHDEVVLLYWKDWADRIYMEAARASHGESFPNGYSNMSRHGYATHWMPLPSPPPTSDGGGE